MIVKELPALPEVAASSPDAFYSDASAVDPAEFGTLAASVAKTYRTMVDFYRTSYEKSLPEAMELEAAQGFPGYLQSCRDTPPDQVTWHTMRALEEASPGDSLRKWEEVKAFARNELTSGARGAFALDTFGSGPMERARYTVLVNEMAKDWEPLTGIERLLIEQMAQAFTLQLYWTDILAYRETYNVGSVDRSKGEWSAPTITKQQALDNAAAMVDRWNRMFLRCLRQLRDLRRYSPVVIQNAGQVNVGGQQVNLSQASIDNQQSPVNRSASKNPLRVKRRRR